VIDARGILVMALALVATTVVTPAAVAVSSREPAPRRSSTPAVDSRHQALIDRHGAVDRRRSEIRHPSRRAARPVASQPASVRVASDGLDWGDALVGAGSVLGIGLVASGAAVGLGHRRQRMGHPVN